MLGWHTKPASNLGPLSARQRNAIRMAFRWRADSGSILRAYWVEISVLLIYLCHDYAKL